LKLKCSKYQQAKNSKALLADQQTWVIILIVITHMKDSPTQPGHFANPESRG